MAKTVKQLASDNSVIRRRMSELTDRILVLEKSLQLTQDRIQKDMTGLVETVQEMRKRS